MLYIFTYEHDAYMHRRIISLPIVLTLAKRGASRITTGQSVYHQSAHLTLVHFPDAQKMQGSRRNRPFAGTTLGCSEFAVWFPLPAFLGVGHNQDKVMRVSNLQIPRWSEEF